MTCPSCGTIAGVGVDRCARCGSSLDIPAHQPRAAIPIVRAPTNRGELAQRAAGIVVTPLVPPRSVDPAAHPGGPTPQPWPAPDLAAPPIARPALGAPVGQSATGFAPQAPPPAPMAAWATQPPPPPTAGYNVDAPTGVVPATYLDATHVDATHIDATASVTSQLSVDSTAVNPSGSPAVREQTGVREQHALRDATRSADETSEETRHRPVRPGVDASWPPPPGPWSGRRTTES